MSVRTVSAWEGPLLKAATLDSFRKLDPRVMVRNPVMFVVEVGAVLTTVLGLAEMSGFTLHVSVWLWFTVIFANFA